MSSPVRLMNEEWSVVFHKNLTPDDAKQLSLSGVMPENAEKFRLEPELCFFNLADLKPDYTPVHDAAIVCNAVESGEDRTLSIGIGCDWWFTCYINGELAATTEPDGNGDNRITPYRHRCTVSLKKGINYVAIQLRPGIASWGFSFAFLPDFTYWPENQTARKILFREKFPEKIIIRASGRAAVNRVSVNSASVSVLFNHPAAACLRLYRDGTLIQENWTRKHYLKTSEKIHRFDLTGLEPETEYRYEILFLDESVPALSPADSGSFTTFPAEHRNHSFCVFGDTQVSAEMRRRFYRECEENNLLAGAFRVFLGDMSMQLDDLQEDYFDNFLNLLKREKEIPVVPVHGNHEYRGRERDTYAELFGEPYYSFCCGDVMYIVLDSGDDQPVNMTPRHFTLRNDLDNLFREQAQWLAELVQTDEFRNAKRRILLSHSGPVAPSYIAENLEKLLAPYFYGKNAPYKLDLWIAGHQHRLFYFDPVSRQMHSLSGEEQTFPYTCSEGVMCPVCANDGSDELFGIGRLSVMQFDIGEDRIAVRVYRSNGTLLKTIEF